MRLAVLLRATLTAALAAALIAGGTAAAQASPGVEPGVRHPCATPGPGEYGCYVEVVAPSSRMQALDAKASRISGLKPADIASAYRLKGGHRGLVAVVDAFDDPKLESDLAKYRKTFHLPSCTTKNGCFRKVGQDGTAALPEQDAGWGLEEALDVQAVSAACPGCRILVVEATDDSAENLGTAVNTAVALGAKAVSNSYGGSETTDLVDIGAKYFDHPGTAILAASGDDGFPAASTPATYSSVIAVGGTTLTRKHGRWNETAWEGGGSGCSAYVPKPAWQTDPNCPMRTSVDVAADADPESGLAVYDTFGTADYTDSGWLQVGGTSLSSPLMAGMLVRAGKASLYSTAQRAYTRRAIWRDITAGSNGVCGDDYLCTAVKGYDAPTGIGAPKALDSF